jgi:hypothetical protein
MNLPSKCKVLSSIPSITKKKNVHELQPFTTLHLSQLSLSHTHTHTHMHTHTLRLIKKNPNALKIKNKIFNTARPLYMRTLFLDILPPPSPD